MFNILCEMANPPKMFIDAKKIAEYDKMVPVCEAEFSKDMIPPRMIIPEMAFETLIKGE